MGHTRLGRIPTLKKWQDVIALCGAGPAEAAVPEIAERTLEAAEPALLRAMDDPGLRLAFHALARLALASREEDWDAALARIGVQLPADASVFGLAAALQGAVDDQILAEVGLIRFRGQFDYAACLSVNILSNSAGLTIPMAE